MSIAIPFHRVRAFGTVLSAVALCVAAAAPSFAQAPPPGIDQYLIYRVADNEPALDRNVVLSDQFSAAPTTHVVDFLRFFGLPVEKDTQPLYDPVLHYAWWHITPQPFAAQLLVNNKYGDQVINLRAAEYLLNPALKFPQPGQPLPVANHYKCYNADGVIEPRPVVLTDQFGSYEGLLTGRVEFFCTPVEKTLTNADGTTTTEPIIRPDAHLVCYEVQLPLTPWTISYLDEFRLGQTVLNDKVMLCVPSMKQEVVPVKQATWGSLKATYR